MREGRSYSFIEDVFYLKHFITYGTIVRKIIAHKELKLIYSSCFQVLNEEKITVNEGDDAGFILAKSNVPPHFFCLLVGKPLYCDVKLHLTAHNTSNQCVNGKAIHQVVFGPKVDSYGESPCSVPITADNWRQTFQIPVYGAVNGIFGMQSETNVMLNIIAGQVQIPAISVSVQVRNIFCEHFLFLSFLYNDPIFHVNSTQQK